jgi:hypothetical protein
MEVELLRAKEMLWACLARLQLRLLWRLLLEPYQTLRKWSSSIL